MDSKSLVLLEAVSYHLKQSIDGGCAEPRVSVLREEIDRYIDNTPTSETVGALDRTSREVLQELLDDVEEAIIATSNAVGKGTLRIDGVPLNPSQEAERLSGLCLKRRRIMDVLK